MLSYAVLLIYIFVDCGGNLLVYREGRETYIVHFFDGERLAFL